MNPKLVTADPRGRVTVAEANRTYLVHEDQDGTLILEPAVVMSELERGFLANTALQEQIEYARSHPEKSVNRRPGP